jgi:hypothetical protein
LFRKFAHVSLILKREVLNRWKEQKETIIVAYAVWIAVLPNKPRFT